MKTNLSLLQKKTLVLLMIGFALSACASQAHEKEAALLPVDSTQARAEIIELISQSFGGKKIPIAKNAFQDSSRLLLGKTGVTSPQGIKVISSDKEVALVFELVKQGENCLLRRANTKQEWLLETKRCFKRDLTK